MRPRYIHSSLTRITDFSLQDLEIKPVPRSQWATGDYVLGEITRPSPSLKIELSNGRPMDPMKGDKVIVALGTRHATLESTGTWEAVGDDGRMSLLTGAGLVGKITSRSPFLAPATHLSYNGHVHVDGTRRSMRDYVPDIPVKEYTTPTILIIGTSMSAGKTASGRVITHQLKEAGLRVLGAKLTGAGRYKDILSLKDAGADEIFDFVDVGLPSTVHPKDEYATALDQLLSLMQDAAADIAVVEAGASPLEPYNGDLAVEKIKEHIKCLVLCASDPYAVVGVMDSFGVRPDIVAGVATNTLGGIDLIGKLCGLEALNLTDPNSLPKLKDILRQKVGVNLVH